MYEVMECMYGCPHEMYVWMSWWNAHMDVVLEGMLMVCFYVGVAMVGFQGGDVRKRTKICAHILNLGDIAPPSLHCGPEGIQVTVPATFKVRMLMCVDDQGHSPPPALFLNCKNSLRCAHMCFMRGGLWLCNVGVQVGKSTHTAHIAVRLTPVYLGEG